MNDIEVEIYHNLPQRSFMPFKFTTPIPIEAIITIDIYSNKLHTSHEVIIKIHGNYNTTTGLDLTSIVTNVEVNRDELKIETVPLEVVLEAIIEESRQDQNWADLFIDFADIVKDYYINVCKLKRKREETN